MMKVNPAGTVRAAGFFSAFVISGKLCYNNLVISFGYGSGDSPERFRSKVPHLIYQCFVSGSFYGYSDLVYFSSMSG